MDSRGTEERAMSRNQSRRRPLSLCLAVPPLPLAATAPALRLPLLEATCPRWARPCSDTWAAHRQRRRAPRAYSRDRILRSSTSRAVGRRFLDTAVAVLSVREPSMIAGRVRGTIRIVRRAGGVLTRAVCIIVRELECFAEAFLPPNRSRSAVWFNIRSRRRVATSRTAF